MTTSLPARGTVFTKAPEPSDELRAAFESLSVASVHEAMGQRNLLRGVRPLVPGTRAVGRAITALDLTGSNLTLHAMLEVARPGDFLVCTTQHGPAPGAVWGANVSESARSRGLAGAVIEGHARDHADVEAIGFPLWALGVSPAATGKTRAGWGNVPVVCAGAYVRPGDLIVADADGVAVVPLEDAAWVARAAEARDLREATTLTPRVRAGESLFAVRDWSANFPADGGRLIDTAWNEGFAEAGTESA
ncbi:4-carboxy-4-hydroxy-2-oxoadipate aldolase/oxaloacetate decarboxylase [Spongiactinospora rosea]|uniref:Putative 4-hydroxy-4-methyl-2-oxoglutarate aldolase n=1 Tax=Spongiactinospora rosea TaxID=2248750 RepID=A0A366LQY4_9ACTN|nr:RraA family protein [Spongiactinospora rosea]RBQ15724.1 4-carboxy-4-hydroxy-2-oxoadipate aldolase/oxaloacetate decarboxylase [Spongiactinospora rosea]